MRLPSGAFQEQISLYDLHKVLDPASSASVTPTMTFDDHKNLVTCLAPLPTNPGVFVSGELVVARHTCPGGLFLAQQFFRREVLRELVYAWPSGWCLEDMNASRQWPQPAVFMSRGLSRLSTARRKIKWRLAQCCHDA